jgi:MFS family permease
VSVESESRPAPLFTPAFILACLGSLAAFGSFYLLLASLPVYILGIGGHESDVGLLIGVFSATAVVLRLAVGRATDAGGKRPFILGGATLLLVSCALYPWATSLPLLLALRVLHGVGWSLFGTASSAMVADIIPLPRRGEAMGYFGMAANLAMAVGPAAGVAIMNTWGAFALFNTATLTALVCVVLSFALREPPRRATPVFPSPPGWIERTALLPASVVMLVAMGYASVVSFLPVFASSRGIGNPGHFFTVFAGSLLVARGFTGRLSDRHGRSVVIVPGAVLCAVALGMLSQTHSVEMMLAVAVVYGVGFAAVQPALMAQVVDRAAPERRGVAMGMFTMAMDLGIGAGSMVWGLVAQHLGHTVMYLCSAAVLVTSLGVHLVGTRRQSAGQQPAGRGIG